MPDADAYAYLPRGLSEDESSHYVGLSPNTFREEVKNGILTPNEVREVEGWKPRQDGDGLGNEPVANY